MSCCAWSPVCVSSSQKQIVKYEKACIAKMFTLKIYKRWVAASIKCPKVRFVISLHTTHYNEIEIVDSKWMLWIKWTSLHSQLCWPLFPINFSFKLGAGQIDNFVFTLSYLVSTPGNDLLSSSTFNEQHTIFNLSSPEISFQYFHSAAYEQHPVPT